MTLEEEIQAAGRKIVKDGYDMSVGELMSMYRDGELVINPKYQRYFRWNLSQKTRFIETLLLGIPFPPIFVYSVGRKWELIDGLQRISTILEFAGLLKDPRDPRSKKRLPPSQLEGTTFLPSLANASWDSFNSTSGDNSSNILSDELKFALRRVRVRIEILKNESDPLAKYELFQRLNSGGSSLSEQEIRSCALVQINPAFFDWIDQLAKSESFLKAIDQTSGAIKSQRHIEYVIRFLTFRNRDYHNGLDVHEFLDRSIQSMAADPNFDLPAEEAAFKGTFKLIMESLGSDAFKKWDGARFAGQTSLSAFEFISFGISKHLGSINAQASASEFVESRVKALWSDPVFRLHSKAGVRGTTRLSKLLPLACDFFKP